MRQLWVVFSVVVLLCFNVAFADYSTCVNDTSNATFEVVGGEANKQLHPTRVLFNPDTSGNYKLQCNGTDVWGPFYMSANDIFDVPVDNIICDQGAAEDLDAVKDTAGNKLTVCVTYDKL